VEFGTPICSDTGCLSFRFCPSIVVVHIFFYCVYCGEGNLYTFVLIALHRLVL